MTSDDTKVDTSDWLAHNNDEFNDPVILNQKGRCIALFGQGFDAERDACLHAVQSLPKVTAERDELSEMYDEAFEANAAITRHMVVLEAERDALSARVKELEAAQPYFLTESINLQGVGALVIERDALKHALADMLEDGDKTDREAAMKLLGWDKAAPELQARALIGKEPSK